MEKEKIKLWKKILIVILILLIIFAILTIRKMIIVNDLQNKVSKYLVSTNYHSKLYEYQGDNLTISNMYQKEERYISTMEYLSRDINHKIITYSNGATTNVYFETDGQKTAILNTEPIPILLSPNDYLYTKNAFQFVSNCMTSKITSAECNGKQCYKIDGFFSSAFSWLSGQNTIYIDKNTGLPVRIQNSAIESKNEKINVVMDYFYEFDVVTDDNVKEPDITEFTVQENN